MSDWIVLAALVLVLLVVWYYLHTRRTRMMRKRRKEFESIVPCIDVSDNPLKLMKNRPSDKSWLEEVEDDSGE